MSSEMEYRRKMRKPSVTTPIYHVARPATPMSKSTVKPPRASARKNLESIASEITSNRG